MKNKIFCGALIAMLLALSFPAQAQKLAKIPRIGYLSPFSPSSEPNKLSSEAFHQGLRDLGWTPGKNVNIEYRWADEKYDRLPELATELVGLNVDIIYVVAMSAALAAERATSTIPVVFAGLGDPVSIGVVSGLARPEGNLTGLGGLSLELSGKRLELLKEVAPRIAQVAVLANPSHPMTAPTMREIQSPATALGLRIQVHEVREPEKIEAAFAAMTRQRAGGLMVLQDPLFFSQSKQILSLVAKSRLPTVYVESGWVPAGGLMSYAPSLPELNRRAATYVDKILKGAKPADLPVEQPTKFEFVINLKAAKQIGLTIPHSVLYQADKVIK